MMRNPVLIIIDFDHYTAPSSRMPDAMIFTREVHKRGTQPHQFIDIKF